MKAKVQRVFVFMFVLLLILTLLFNGSSYSASSKITWQFDDIIYNDSFQMLTDNYKNIFLLSCQNNTLHIKRVDKNNNCLSVNFDAPENYIGSAVSNGCVYIFASYIASSGAKTVVVTTYEFDSDSLYAVELKDINVVNKTDFAVSKGNIFCINDSNKRYVNIYNLSGELISKKTNSNNNIQLITSSDGNSVFAFTVDRVYKVNTDGSFDYISNHNLLMPIFLCEDNYVCDLNGAFYNLYSKASMYNATIHNNLPTGAVTDNYYLRAKRNEICGINKNTGKIDVLYNLNKDCTAICSRDNQVMVYCSDDFSFTIFDKSSLNYPKQNSSTYNSAPSQGNNSSQQNKPLSSSSSNAQKLKVTSSVYKINGEYITGIKSGTTIPQFKNNLDFGNLTLSFKNGNNVNKSSGNVGTGYALSCTYNSKIYYTYELIVAGDLTGEGSVNSRDASVLSDYLIDKGTLSKCESMAADCNNDGVTDTMDLLKIAKNNV